MHETSKSIARRLHTPGFVRYFRGHGIDIGAGADGLHQWKSLFPLMDSCVCWDKEQGDAQFMEGVKDASFDFVHSAHCLEHLFDPHVALHHWWRILKPGGHLVVMVPDEDLYEQGLWPSAWNNDHKHTFTVFKGGALLTDPPSHKINVMDLVANLGIENHNMQPVLIHLLDSTYRYERPREDQTLNVVTESAIEFVLRKRP